MYHSLWVLVDFMEGDEAGETNYNLFLFSLVRIPQLFLINNSQSGDQCNVSENMNFS